MAERWLPVPGYEGVYSVSDLGRVRSEARSCSRSDGKPMNLKESMLSPGGKPGGHRSLNLRKDGKYKKWYVHQLVMLAFVGPCPEGMEVCHFPDPNPLNNRLENLMYGTRKTNAAHSVVQGLNRNSAKDRCNSGHEFTPDNILWKGPDKKHRQCRECARRRTREWKQRRKIAS